MNPRWGRWSGRDDGGGRQCGAVSRVQHTRRAAIRFCSSSFSASFVARGVRPARIDPDAVGRVRLERVAAAVLLRVSHLHPQARRWRAPWRSLANRRGLRCARNWLESIPEPRTAWRPASWTSRFWFRESPCASCIRSFGPRSMKTCPRPSEPIFTPAPLACCTSNGPIRGRLRCTFSRRQPSGDAEGRDHAAGGSAIGTRRAEPPTPPPRCSVGRSMNLRETATGRWCCSNSETPSTKSGMPPRAVHLREAGETTADPMVRARAFTALAWTTHPDARHQREQLPLYELAASEVRGHDRELALELEAARLGALLLNPDLPRSSKTRPAVSRTCLLRPARNACCDRSLPAAPWTPGRSRWPAISPRRSRRIPHLVSQGGHPLWRTNITICLVEAERYDVADHMLSRAIRHAERVGSPQWLARALWLRGLARHRSGDLRAAEADGRAAVDMHGLTADYTKTPGLVVVVDSLADQGRPDEGEVLLTERGMDGELAADAVLRAAACSRAGGAVPPWGTMCGPVPTWRMRYAGSR